MDIDENKGFYDFDLDIQLETQIDSYEQDRQRYWEALGDFSAIQFDQAERFAEAVLKNSEKLIPIEEMDGDLSKLQYEMKKSPKKFDKRITEILNSGLPSEKKTALICDVLKDYPEDPRSEDSPLKLVWERFVIKMSWEAVGKIEEGAKKIFQLYNLVLCSTPSKSTQQFLGRLSRCYIWGFDPECIILCRAVIETAFNDSVTYEICEKHCRKHSQIGDFSLKDRIEAALKDSIIDKDIAKKAQTVRQRGNQAAHRQPSITNVWGIICDTVAILERITQKK